MSCVEPMFSWILENTLEQGFWWMLPTFLVVCKAFREGYADPYYYAKLKKSLKIRGAIMMFKSKAEHLRIKCALLRHINLVLPSTYGTFTIGLNMVLNTYKRNVRFGSWTTEIRKNLYLDGRFGTHAVYYVTQLALIMMHYGLENTTCFMLLETRMDIAITNMYNHLLKTAYYIQKPKKYTFRQILRAIQGHEEHFKFLYVFKAFVFSNQIPRISEYAFLEHLWIWCNKRYRNCAIESLPSFAKGAMALLAFVDVTKHAQNVNQVTQRKINRMMTYLKG